MCCLNYALKYTHCWKYSSIGSKGRVKKKNRNIEGEGPIEFVSITGTHMHPPKPMKHKLCEAKTEHKKNLSSEQCGFSLDDVCIVAQQKSLKIGICKFIRRIFLTAIFFYTAKFPCGEISVPQNLLQRNFLTANFLYGKISLWRNFITVNFPTAKFTTANFTTGKFPVWQLFFL